MPVKFECPACYLSDQYGRRLDPCNSNGIHYTILSCHRIQSQKRGELSSGEALYLYQVTVSIQGYLTVSINYEKISSPIPFSDTQTLTLYAPGCSNILFTVRSFSCHADPIFHSDQSSYQLELTVDIETIARSVGEADVIVRGVTIPCNTVENKQISDADYVWITAYEIFDRVSFASEITIPYTRTLLKAEVYQYNAYSDGVKKIYTNADEITEYGDQGIPNPNTVSYLSTFINGVRQPQTNYTVTEGVLSLLTTEAPITGAPILIRFIMLKDKDNHLLKGELYQYNALSNGVKRKFTDTDEILMYGNQGILNPDHVSFYNVYINGELQPKTNYVLSQGLLILTSSDIPLAGAPVIVEFITVKSADDKLLKATLSQYNTLGAHKNLYTNQDELTMYGNQGIPDPQLASYQNLSINGVIQPSVNYTVSQGLLTLKTDGTPLSGVPICLQSVSFYEE